MSLITTQDTLLNYHKVRAFSEQLCEPLEAEDYVIQTMADVSPTKWHLAHTTWFFENFILKDFFPSYSPFHPLYNYLFNSYYNAVGVRHCRAKRGQISRPTVEDIYEYRGYVDDHLRLLMDHLNDEQMAKVSSLLELGINHEQQHQELILTDIKHVLACNPLHPIYAPREIGLNDDVPPLEWTSFKEGLYSIGHIEDGFGFDNEFPSHKVFLNGFRIASRLITNQEYLEFMKDGGYKHSEFWLSDGWDCVSQNDWIAPLYWDKLDGSWFYMSLNGFVPIDLTAPVCHVSFYEASAFACWAGHRLLREEEWEAAARQCPIEGNFVENNLFHPTSVDPNASNHLSQMFGDVWEWTASPYVGYPGYRPAKGALGEYNGKFMSNQMVLRGGSCATSLSHIRPTYRNFFPPSSRWQFSGIRLGDDL
jgi:ergothioneine biosynthesis protein EgtB